MKKLFYSGLLLLTIFEILSVYFIMPLPGSQQLNTLELAYLLHSYRWYFRIIFFILMLFGIKTAINNSKRWIPASALIITALIIYFFNFRMTAEKMFLQPEKLVFDTKTESRLADSTTVLAVTIKGESKAYPLRYIIYHHQVRDSIAGKPIMVTYCSVCRTGRVFDPEIDGQPENFRLVGMDHFNAMFEDATTKSWWMQATGEAVVGPRKGKSLNEIESSQLTLLQYFQLLPLGKVMQPDKKSWPSYDTLGRYEWGNSKSELTGTDSLSWKEKSWIVGIQYKGVEKAYDWNTLKKERIIRDTINATPIIIILASDNQTFSAFQVNSVENFTFQNDTLYIGTQAYNIQGFNQTDKANQLVKLQAYQEFWHSWRTFHPKTLKYNEW